MNRWFDSAVISGLKFYSLQKVLHNRDKAEINKLKGGSASKLCHQDCLDLEDMYGADMHTVQVWYSGVP